MLADVGLFLDRAQNRIHHRWRRHLCLIHSIIKKLSFREAVKEAQPD